MTTDTLPTDDARPSPPARRRRRRWTIALVGGAAFVALAVFVLAYFQPQKLIFDDKVNEELPGFVATAPPVADQAEVVDAEAPIEEAAPVPDLPTDPLSLATAEAASKGVPVAVTSGEFVSLDHPTSGTAFLVVEPDGSLLLRIEDLDTDNGPDLRVVLNTADVGTDDYEQLTELGGLKGNIGDQNYEIPPELDLETIRSVVIWCERFSAPFGEAPLSLGA